MSLKGCKLENQFSLYLVWIDWIPALAYNGSPLIMNKKSSQSSQVFKLFIKSFSAVANRVFLPGSCLKGESLFTIFASLV